MKHLAARSARLLPLALLGLLSVSPLAATTFVRVSDEDLADQAEFVAEVVVRGLGAAVGTVHPMTEYTLEVDQVLRGQVDGNSVKLRVLGGQDASGRNLKIWGAPEFEVNDRALLFLTSSEDGTYRVLHFHQGAFGVRSWQGQPLALRNFAESSEVELPDRAQALPAEGPRNLNLFKSWLVDRYRGVKRPVDYLVQTNVALDQFVLTVRNGKNFRWQEFDSNANVFFDAHNVPQPGLPSGGYAEFQVAIQAWNDDASNIRYRFGSVVNNSKGFRLFDEVNSIVFDNADDADGDSFTSDFNCAMGGTLAIGGPWFDEDFTHVYQSKEYITIIQADIVTNKGLLCFLTGNSLAAEEVFAHELGHTLGLSHSADGNALMFFQAHDDGRGARITADDSAAVAVLYGASGGGSTPPAAPSSLGASNGATAINLSWNDNSGNESGFSIERRSSGSFSEIATVGTNVSNYADSTATTGTSFTYRVRAFNGAGASGYSNETSATLPGEKPPSNVIAVIQSATEIKLNWIDNAASETSYEIEAKINELSLGYRVVTTAPGNSSTATLIDLIPETTYTFRVRAKGLLGNSSYSNEVVAATPLAPISACVESATETCLSGERFKVGVRWRTADSSGKGQKVTAPSADSGIFYFFSPDNWEMLVKVLNACGINNRIWVFAAATTTVEYVLVVTDSTTGKTTIFGNPLGTSAAAITSIDAFAACSAATEPGPSAVTALAKIEEELESFAPALAIPPKAGACMEGTTTTCLNANRFKVEVNWRDFVGMTGTGKVVTNAGSPFGTDDSGLFYFFTSDNWELLVKVLNGCAINGKYWVFAAATTNVEYQMTVTDTGNGAVPPRQYSNALGVASPAFTDVGAFSCTP